MNILNIQSSKCMVNIKITILLIISMLMISCGGENGLDEGSNETGTTALVFSLELEGEPTTAARSAEKAAIDCVANGISTIQAVVLDASNTVLASGGPWNCDDGSGAITGNMAGSNRRVVITGNNASATTVYWGEASVVTVRAGETNDIGTVTLASGEPNPIQPSVVQPVLDQNGEVVLQSNSSMFATSYNIYWSTTSGVTSLNGTVIANVSVSSSFIHTGVQSGETYYYVVTSVNSAGESVESSEVSITITPSAPQNVSVIGGNSESTISWNPVTGATSYNLYWSTTAGVTKQTGTLISNVTSPYTHTGLVAGQEYFYVVTAVNSGGDSNESSETCTGPGCSVQTFEDGLLTGWVVGGRQGGSNASGVQLFQGSQVAFLQHSSFTELTLAKTFNYTPGDIVNFDAEFSINGDNSPSASGGSSFYSMARYQIHLFNAAGDVLGNSEWAASTSTYPYTNNISIEFTPVGMQHYAIDIAQVASSIDVPVENIDTFRLTFIGYSSWNSSDTILIRFDNVGVTNPPSWSISKDFSLTENPNGAWSYGRKFTPTASAFDVLPLVFEGSIWWFGNLGHGAPGVSSGAHLWAKDNSNGLPVVRWTSPAAGFYSIDGFFMGNWAAGVDVTAYLVVNDQLNFTDVISAHLERKEFLINPVYLEQGDTVDFLIQWNGNISAETSWTQVDATITALEGISDISAGLVAHYPFNGNANDVSGNANNGAITGATLTADQFGADLSAYQFDGIDDSINLGSGASLNLGAVGTSYTVGVWFKTAGNVGSFRDHLIGKASTINNLPNPYGILLDDDNTIIFQVGDASQPYLVESTNAYADNAWHHAVGVRDNNTLSLYMDGALVAGPTEFSIADARSTADTFISSYTPLAVSGELFTGQMDDVRIYNRALSLTELEQLFTEGGQNTGAITAPANVLVNLGSGESTISWDAAAGATSYNLYWSTTPGVTALNGTKITNVISPFTHTGLTSGETYYYVVTAENIGGESSESVESNITVPPASPTGIRVASGDGIVSLWWNDNGADSYNIYWSTLPGVTKNTGTLITSVTSSITHQGLTNGETYHYVVTSVNISGESLDSPEFSVIVEPFASFSEGFESGLGSWAATNGVWEVGGPPAAGPLGCIGGTVFCAGTILDGNYPDGVSSRLQSPSIQLPALGAGEEIQLRFWHWFSLDNDDGANVRIQEETAPGVWGVETELATVIQYAGNSGGVWTRPLIDLSAYAGKKIRLLFLLHSNRYGGGAGVSSGWYLDDIQVTVVTGSPLALPFSDDFETGLGGWSATNGIWEVGGSPAAGPLACNGGSVQCAGTILDGNYPDGVNSRLQSPSIQLPALGAGEEIQLRFWHWFSLDNDDGANVRIQEETAPGVWGVETELATVIQYAGNSGGVWTRPLIDLSAYAGKKIRLLFLLHSNRYGGGAGVSSGWYLDDIQVTVVTGSPLALPFSDDFETGLGGWSATNGIWEVGGSPAAGPLACNGGSVQCAGTILDGNYPDGVSSRLQSPSIQLPALGAGEEIQLRFWHWFSLDNDDGANVRIQEQTAPGVWGVDTELATVIDYAGNSGGAWTRPLIDLSAYAGKKIRLLFLLHSNRYGGGAGVSSGWYLDEVTVFVQ